MLGLKTRVGTALAKEFGNGVRAWLDWASLGCVTRGSQKKSGDGIHATEAYLFSRHLHACLVPATNDATAAQDEESVKRSPGQFFVLPKAISSRRR